MPMLLLHVPIRLCARNIFHFNFVIFTVFAPSGWFVSFLLRLLLRVPPINDMHAECSFAALIYMCCCSFGHFFEIDLATICWVLDAIVVVLGAFIALCVPFGRPSVPRYIALGLATTFYYTFGRAQFCESNRLPHFPTINGCDGMAMLGTVHNGQRTMHEAREILLYERNHKK